MFYNNNNRRKQSRAQFPSQQIHNISCLKRYGASIVCSYPVLYMGHIKEESISISVSHMHIGKRESISVFKFLFDILYDRNRIRNRTLFTFFKYKYKKQENIYQNGLFAHCVILLSILNTSNGNRDQESIPIVVFLYAHWETENGFCCLISIPHVKPYVIE